jgi:hypothetical protein
LVLAIISQIGISIAAFYRCVSKPEEMKTQISMVTIGFGGIIGMCCTFDKLIDYIRLVF